MKILDTPRTGKCGNVVAFQSRFGLCLRELVIPQNTITPERQFMRAAFGHHSQVFSHKLTEEQQDRWMLAAAQVLSNPTLGQSGILTAQQLYTGINSVRSRVLAPETFEVPAPVVFKPSPVGQLVIEYTEAGVRLLLRIEGDLTEDVMVFGQEPCSGGRRKRRNVAYLGLLPPPINGMSDITYLYKARYAEPRPGQRVFIVTCQQKDGWKAQDRDTHALVPDPPQARQTLAEPSNSDIPHMHKGSSSDAKRLQIPPASQSPGGPKPEARVRKAAESGSAGGGGGDGAG